VPAPDLGRALFALAAVDRTGALQRARNVVLVDDLKYDARRIVQKVEKPATIDWPQRLLEDGWHHPEAGIDEPGTPSGRTVADLDRIKHDDVEAPLGKVQRRR
jgi:hypothetical protein